MDAWAASGRKSAVFVGHVQVMRSLLWAAEYDVLTAHSGEEAVEVGARMCDAPSANRSSRAGPGPGSWVHLLAVTMRCRRRIFAPVDAAHVRGAAGHCAAGRDAWRLRERLRGARPLIGRHMPLVRSVGTHRGAGWLVCALWPAQISSAARLRRCAWCRSRRLPSRLANALGSLGLCRPLKLPTLWPCLCSFLQACVELRKMYSPTELPVIFITCSSLEEDVIRGLAVGGARGAVESNRKQHA
jgi:hypothetical protein